MDNEQAIDPVVLALTGQLPSIIILAAVLAYLISLLLLWLYRRAVLRFMNRQSSGAMKSSSVASSPPASEPLPPLELVTISANTDSIPKNNPALSQLITRRQWQAAAVYGTAGAVFVLLMTFVWLTSSGFEFRFFPSLMIFWIMAWPIVLTVNFITASTRRILLVSTGIYFAVYFLLSLIVLIRNPEMPAHQILSMWLSFNLMPTVLLLLFLNRQIRAIGPMVLVFMIIGLTGSVVASTAFSQNEVALRTLIEMTSFIGLGDHTFVSVLVAGFAFFALFGWLLLMWIRSSYESKKLSDQAILLDSVWIIFGISHVASSLAFENIVWAWSVFVIFLAYKAAVLIGFRIVHKSPIDQHANIRLLLLRVFKLGKRSEHVFDGITKHWRYAGSVQLIAGPDLATTTIEPHEFLEFLNRKLTRLFIQNQSDFDQRLNNMDTRPDFDGRFRINDFFCYENTWEMVLSRLVQQSDVILMDLRSFSPERQGCIRELSELVHRVLIERVVLLVDETTDFFFLEQTIRQCWSTMPASSPNAIGTAKVLRLFRLDSRQTIPVSQLISELCLSAMHLSDSTSKKS